MGNTFGQLFRVTTFGESHGGGVGAVIDGCPPRIALEEKDLQRELDRRRPGQHRLTSARAEKDHAEILSGVFEGQTLGTPILVLVRNEDARPQDYAELRETYRPSHADYTYQAKYGIRNWQGGGRASARETLARVAAGAIARKVLAQLHPAVEIIAYVLDVCDLTAAVDREKVTAAEVEANALRCPDEPMAAKMMARIAQAQAEGDSLGGVIECLVRHAPAGLGEPVFDKLEAELARAVMSIPATKGFEIGSGFSAARMRGSEHNDAFEQREERIATRTNFSGGIQGGISNGETIYFRVAFKPTATIAQAQQTVTSAGQAKTIAARGRHDPCVLPRAVPIVEAMTALVLTDHALRHRAVDLA